MKIVLFMQINEITKKSQDFIRIKNKLIYVIACGGSHSSEIELI